METEKIKISLSLQKIVYFLLAAGLIWALAWWMGKSNKSQNGSNKPREIVMPIDFGVADPGFEGKISNFTTLNAKASVDKNAKIDGASSLKMAFSDQSITSVKVSSYFNNINEGDYYRLSFWAKSDSESNKKVALRLAEKEKNQDLGEFSLNKNEDAKYLEFNFQAGNAASDLIFTSTDKIANSVWIDDVSVEKIDVSSVEELKDLKPTIFGRTTWKNVDQSQGSEGSDSGNFLSKPKRKIGQIFQPSRENLSGVALKILRHGTGGTGTFQLQIREFDEKLGIISDEVLASATVNQVPSPEATEEMKKKSNK